MALPIVVYRNNMPSPYVVGRFNAIARRGNLRLEAWFDQVRGRRSWNVDETTWEFPARYLEETYIGKRSIRLPVVELQSTRPDLFVSIYGAASYYAGMCVAGSLARRTALRVLPTYDTWVRRSTSKEVGKHMLFRSVDAVKVPGSDGANMAKHYGVSIERIHRVTQSVDIQLFGTAMKMDAEERRAERAKRGLHGCVFLYVGRLWSGKGIDTLIDAYERMVRDRLDVTLLVVGDGPEEGYYRSRAGILPGVHFEGFVQPNQLPRIYSLADVFVFPTLGDPYGLVVEEAMLARLPIISSESAGDIRRRLHDGEAGYVITPQDVDALEASMKQLLADPKLRSSMGGYGRQLALGRSHEQYAMDFERFAEQTLSMPKVTGPFRLTSSLLGQAAAKFRIRRRESPLLVTGEFSEPLV